MLAYGAWAHRQREDTLVAESEREIRAYATALALAVERGLRYPELGDVQDIIDRLGREPTVYGVLVYDTAGAVAYASEAIGVPEPVGDSVLATVLGGATASLRRSLDDEPVLGVLRPLTLADGRVAGALEVAQPLAFVAAEQSRIRQRFLLNTLTLAAALSIMVTWLVRRYVSRPLDGFVDGVRALGGGDLDHRLDERAPGAELSEVARELNRMAGRLQSAREELVREVDERVSLERRLQQTEKMAAVGTLAAGLAHEIGAPLHVIRGRADLVLSRDPEPEVRSRNLRIIIEQIDRITLIVRNLLGFARRREPNPAPVDVGRIVRDVTGFVEGDAERRGVRIDVAAPADGPVVSGDADLLHQVVLNLVMNGLQALDAVEGDRRLSVSVAPEGRPSGPGVAVVFADSGPGIPPDLRQRIFDPFFTTKDALGGTGLGLAVARGIVEDHGGTIEVEDVESGADRAAVAVASVGGGQNPGEADHRTDGSESRPRRTGTQAGARVPGAKIRVWLPEEPVAPSGGGGASGAASGPVPPSASAVVGSGGSGGSAAGGGAHG